MPSAIPPKHAHRYAGPGTAANPAVHTVRQPAANHIHPRREPIRSASHGTSSAAGTDATPITASTAPADASLHPRSM